MKGIVNPAHAGCLTDSGGRKGMGLIPIIDTDVDVLFRRQRFQRRHLSAV